MLAYQGDAEDHGAMLAFYSRLERAEHTGTGSTWWLLRGRTYGHPHGKSDQQRWT